MGRTIYLPLLLLAACQQADQPPQALVGAAWVQQQSGSQVRFQAVSASSDDVVWASGTHGTFARSVNGGSIWQVGTVAGAETLEFRDVQAIDSDYAFLMSAGPGEDSRIYRTQDGGASWTEVFRNIEPDGFFDCMSFWDGQRGIAFSDPPDSDFMLMVTDDGGDTWSRIDPDLLEDARENEGGFAASGTCLLTGEDGHAWFGTGASGVDSRVFRTTDFGASWSASVTPIPSTSGSSGIFTLAFSGVMDGVVLGGEYTRPDSAYGHSALTTDGGATWSPAGDTGLGGSVFGSAFLPGAPTPTLLAVAPTGSAWSTDGGASWSRIDGDSYWAVGASPGGAAWAVGPGGRIARLNTTTDEL